MSYIIFLASCGVVSVKSSFVEIPLKQIPSMSGYNITSSMLFLGPSYKSMTRLGCAVQCSQSDSCLSYFYNTKQCQFHMEVFLGASGAATQPGTEYFYKHEIDTIITTTSEKTTTTTTTTTATTSTTTTKHFETTTITKNTTTTTPTTTVTTTTTTTSTTTTTTTTPSTTTTTTSPTTTTTTTTTSTTTTTTSPTTSPTNTTTTTTPSTTTNTTSPTTSPTTTTTTTTPSTTTTTTSPTTSPTTTTTTTTPSTTTTTTSPTTTTTTTTTMTTPTATPVSCPAELGFQVLGSDEMCVKFHTDIKTWSEANTVCASYSPNGHLVVVDTETKNTLVRDAGIAMNSQFRYPVSIGLNMTHGWTDGSPLTYQQWSSPLYEPGIRECTAYSRRENWIWYTKGCDRRRHYICQI